MQKAEGVNGAYIEMPFDLGEVFGVKRLKTKATFDSAIYQGSIVRMNGKYLIRITKAIREQIGKEAGDMVHVVIEKDEEERKVEIPDDFRQALEKDSDAFSFYKNLSYTNKSRYYQWVASAKKEETRKNRIVQSIEKLHNKEKL